MSQNGALRRALFLAITITIAYANFDISQCGKSKHCVSHPSTCFEDSLDGCDYLFSYVPLPENNKVLQMELYTKRTSPAIGYVSVGFSKDNVMGDDFVTHCASVDGKPVEAHFSRNDGKSNKVLENSQMESNSLTLISSESADGHIYCKYQHLLNDAAIMPDGSMNLNEPLFLLWARGPVRDPKSDFYTKLSTKIAD
jgi:hypothetical protein